MKKETKEKVNLLSLVIGIALIITGLGGVAIFISTKNSLTIASIISLILGAILALMGGLRKWS